MYIPVYANYHDKVKFLGNQNISNTTVYRLWYISVECTIDTGTMMYRAVYYVSIFSFVGQIWWQSE
jgi:hypothetical protein